MANIKRYTGKATLRSRKINQGVATNGLNLEGLKLEGLKLKEFKPEEFRPNGLKFDSNGNIKSRIKKSISGLSTKSKVGLGVAIPTALGASTYGIYRHNKNKKEKTAYEIVIDAFEKMA